MIIARQPRRYLGAGSIASTGVDAATGALSFTNPEVGLMSAGTAIVGNLLSCGTIGKTGCNKRSDAQLQISGIEAMRQTAYAAETGQMSPQQAVQQIGQISQQIYNGYINKSSGNSFNMGTCGPDSGIPATSQSAALMCNQTVSLNGFTQALQQLVATFGQAQASPALPPTSVIPSGNLLALQAGAGAPPGAVLPNPQPTGPSLSTVAVIGVAAIAAVMALA